MPLNLGLELGIALLAPASLILLLFRERRRVDRVFLAALLAHRFVLEALDTLFGRAFAGGWLDVSESVLEGLTMTGGRRRTSAGVSVHSDWSSALIGAADVRLNAVCPRGTFVGSISACTSEAREGREGES